MSSPAPPSAGAVESWPGLVQVVQAFQAHEEAHAGACAYESPERRAARYRKEDGWLAALDVLENRLPIGSPAWMTHGVLRYELAARVASRVAQFHLWSVSPATGWHLEVPRALRAASHDSPERRERIIDMLRRLPGDVDQRTRELQEGAARGYTPPRQSVEVVCDQLAALLGSRGLHAADEDSALEEIVRRSVRPALSRYRDFLSGSYQAAARENSALAAMPDGLQIYQSHLFQTTSLPLDVDELLDHAHQEMERVESELRAALKAVHAHGSEEAAKRWLREGPQCRHRSRAQMLAYVRTWLARFRNNLAALFFDTPEAPLTVEAMTAAEERTGALVYYQAPEGAAAARVVINTAHARTRLAWELRSLAAHEGYPGHHLERTYSDSRSAKHAAIRGVSCVGFREGWACYAERLATEPSSGASGVERAGYLLRALSLWLGAAIEARFHAGRISRDEGVALFRRHAALSPRDAARRMDFIIAVPGYAAAYLMGYREILQLRDTAQTVLGNRLDLRQFHDVVLRDGPITLPMLRAKVSSWLQPCFNA